MTEAIFTKVGPGLLAPADQEAQALVKEMKIGESIRAKTTKPRQRNILFHKKFFALLNLAFEVWEPTETHIGTQVEKNFEKFRGDILILAGHSKCVASVDGKVEVQPKSIAFSKLTESAFDEIYKTVLTVVWRKIMANAGYASEYELQKIVDRLLSFE